MTQQPDDKSARTLQEAFALLDAMPLQLGSNPPNTASFVDDDPNNPVQICDAAGNQLLLMSYEDYEQVRQHTRKEQE